jgi:hypothetical protein
VRLIELALGNLPEGNSLVRRIRDLQVCSRARSLAQPQYQRHCESFIRRQSPHHEAYHCTDPACDR